MFSPTGNFIVGAAQVAQVLDTNVDGVLTAEDGQSWLGAVTGDLDGFGITLTIIDDTIHIDGRNSIAAFQIF